MELFHFEYQQEQQQFLSQKEREESEKLEAVLKYTKSTFNRLGFDEAEIFQISESVRYFVSNRQALSCSKIRISKTSFRNSNCLEKLRLEHRLPVQYKQ